MIGRSQRVSSGVYSSPVPLPYGVPQGSILSPMLFAVYMLPLGEIIRCHDLVYHCYADDTPLYVFFVPGSENPITTLNGCLAELQEGMSASWLRLNPDKTEVLIMTRRSIANQQDLHLGVQNYKTLKMCGISVLSWLVV